MLRTFSDRKTDVEERGSIYPRLLLAGLWIGSVVLLLFQDRSIAFIAMGFGLFMLIVWLVTSRLVRQKTEAEATILRAVGSHKRLIARATIVAASVTVVFLHLLAVNKVLGTPYLESGTRAIARLAPVLGSGLPNFVIFALLPGLLVIALGARRRELGLTRPSKRTVLATLAVTSLFLISWIWRMTHGGPSMPVLGLFLVHNCLSNGFSEEFQTKGLVLSHLRGFMQTEWALAAMAILVALLHSADAIHDERTVVAILANGIALNVPMNYFLGRAALRTRSLFLPVAVHLALDTTRNVWM